jgi:hypothetical protein
MRNKKKFNWKHFLIGYPVVLIFLTSTIFAIKFSYYLVVSRESFINYISMEGRQESGVIKLKVVREGKIGTELSFVDTLNCKTDGEFEFRSSFPSSGFVRKEGTVQYEFEYAGNLPDKAETCFVQSLVTAHLPYGIDKKQIVTTPVFDWVQ